ncbi:hypothetical protein LJB83_02195 [Clostridia bacterium OttesenSCG-928-F22]|nr:hypothetical protein [Clostridia bacterium OttesenSCG-928-F22]
MPQKQRADPYRGFQAKTTGAGYFENIIAQIPPHAYGEASVAGALE